MSSDSVLGSFPFGEDHDTYHMTTAEAKLAAIEMKKLEGRMNARRLYDFKEKYDQLKEERRYGLD
jgi:hypothetical protein